MHLQHCDVLLQLALTAVQPSGLASHTGHSRKAGAHLQHCDVMLQLALQAAQLLGSTLRPGPRPPHLTTGLHAASSLASEQPQECVTLPAHAGVALETHASGATPLACVTIPDHRPARKTMQRLAISLGCTIAVLIRK